MLIVDRPKLKKSTKNKIERFSVSRDYFLFLQGNQKEIKGQSDFAEPRCETLDSRQWFAA